MTTTEPKQVFVFKTSSWEKDISGPWAASTDRDQDRDDCSRTHHGDSIREALESFEEMELRTDESLRWN